MKEKNKEANKWYEKGLDLIKKGKFEVDIECFNKVFILHLQR